MNDLQNSILESISILADSASRSTPTTLTVEAVILESVDIGSGLYLVEYLGNKFKAYSDVSSKYEPGELVYVIIPNGDFTKNKIILRAVTPTAKNYIQDTTENVYYTNVSDNLLDYSNVINLNSYHNGEIEIEAKEALRKLKESLNKYISTEINAFKLGASVQTEVLAQKCGNYGLRLEIPVADGGMRYITLDTRDILGNPYSLTTATPQSKIFNLDNIDIERDIRLFAFVEGFLENAEITENDITLSALNLFGVQPVVEGLNSNSYNISLTVTNGSLFLDSSDKTISANLLVNGKEVSLDGLDCYWFEEDGLVTSSSDNFMSEGGIGWRCVNKKAAFSTDAQGAKNTQYVLNEYFYTILYSNFQYLSSKNYKCIINYNGILVSQEIEIKNYTSSTPFSVDLYSKSGKNAFIKNSDIVLVCELKNYTLPSIQDDLVYVWHRYDSEGNFIEKDFVEYLYQDKDRTEVTFSSNKIDVLNTIKCYIYTLDSETKNLKLLGSKSLNVSIANDNAYFAIVTPNNLLYKYDEDGDSPLVADYNGSTGITAIEPLEVNIYKRDGTELSEEEYKLAKINWVFEKDSLIVFKGDSENLQNISNLLKYSSKSFPYSIAETYNRDKAEKPFYVEIEIDNTILKLEPNIQFLKEKESGLNGSKYTGLIFYNDRSYDAFSKERGHNLVGIAHNYQGNCNWYCFDKDGGISPLTGKNLKVKVYQSNVVLTEDKYDVTWSLLNASSLSINAEGTLTASGNNLRPSIIQAKISIKQRTDTDTQEVLYCYYPIDVISYIKTGKNATPENILLPLMTGGYNFVTYSKEGTHPKYDDKSPFRISCFYNEEQKVFDNFNWSVSNNKVLVLEDSGNASVQTIIPINRFDQPADSLFASASLTLSAFSGEVPSQPSEAEKNAEIQVYEDNKVYLERLMNEVDNIYKNNWLTNVSKCEILLAYREAFILDLNKLIAILDNILVVRNANVQATRFKEEILTLKERIYTFNENYENYLLDLEYDTNAVGENKITKILGSDFNREIKNYNIDVETLIDYRNKETSDHNNEKRAYDNIRKVSLEDILSEQERERVLSQYLLVENKVNEIISGIKYQMNSVTLNNYFGNVNIILNNYGIYSLGHWILNSQILSQFNNEILKIEKNYSDSVIAYELAVKHKNSSELRIDVSRPILFTYDRDGLSTVQGWDGNKLFINENNKNEYLTSLRAAVGTYSQVQTFTLEGAPAAFNGIALGTHVDVIENGKTVVERREQGIYGYHQGQQTFMLDATRGRATFGIKGQGQIILDPTEERAILKSGNYSETDKTGMLIDLTTPEIKYGNEKFKVDSEGILSAEGATIRGTIYADSGEFKGKVIAGEGSTFAGEITAGSGTFTGSITATAGQFGNLLIQDGKIVIITEFDEDGNPVNSKDFIDASGNTTIDFAEQGKVLTALTSNVGGWTVVGTPSAQMLQGTGKLLLNPQNNSLNYSDVNISTTTNTSVIQSGFYLGKEGLNIPNVIQITPNASDGQRWTLNSQTLEWHAADTATGSRTIKIGANGVNLLNKFLIDNESVKLNCNKISFGDSNGGTLSTSGDANIQAKNLNLVATVTSTLSGKNIVLNSDNIKLSDTEAFIKVGENTVLTTEDNGLKTKLKSSTVYLGANDDITIGGNSILIKEGNEVKIGKFATFTATESKIHNSAGTAKVEANANNVELQAPSAIVLGNMITANVADKKINMTADEIKLSNHITIQSNLVQIINNEVKINSVSIKPNKISATGDFELIGNLTANGATLKNAVVFKEKATAEKGIETISLTVGSMTFTEADFAKLRTIIDQAG